MESKPSGSMNRIGHYCFLLFLLLSFSLGGLVTLNCSDSAKENGYTVTKAEGVERNKDGGVLFTKDENVAPKAEVSVPDKFNVSDTEIAVVWRCPAVKDDILHWEESTDIISVPHPNSADIQSEDSEYCFICFAYSVLDVERKIILATLTVPVLYSPNELDNLSYNSN